MNLTLISFHVNYIYQNSGLYVSLFDQESGDRPTDTLNVQTITMTLYVIIFSGMEITERFYLSRGKVSKKSTCPPLFLPVHGQI